MNDLIQVCENILGESGGEVILSESREFWTTIQKKQLTTPYLTLVLCQCYTLHIGKSKKQNLQDTYDKLLDPNHTISPNVRSKLPGLSPFGRQAFLNLWNTAYFLMFFTNYDANFPQLAAIVNRYKATRKILQKSDPEDVPFVDMILEILSINEPFSNQDMIEYLISKAMVYNKSNDNFPYLNYLKAALLQRINYISNARVIINTICKLLQHPTTSDSSLGYLMTLLRSLLLAWQSPIPSLLQATLNVIKKFYIHPRPLSDYAHDLLTLISAEIKIPGSIVRINAINTYYGISDMSNSAYIMFDQNIPNAINYSNIIQLSTPSPVAPEKFHYSLLANMLLKALSIPDSENCLKKLSKDNLSKFANEAVEMHVKALNMEASKAKSFYMSELVRLHKEILDIHDPSASYFYGTDDLVKVLPMDMTFDMIDCALVVDKITINFQNGTSEVQPASSVNTTVTNTTEYCYPQYPSFNKIVEVIKECAKAKTKQIIKLSVIGNDTTLANIASSFVYLKFTKDTYKNIDFIFYYYPVVESDLGNLIMGQETFYARHVVGLNSMLKSVHPHIRGQTTADYAEERKLQHTQSVKKLDDVLNLKNVISPGSVMRSEMENHFREAGWPLKLNLYQCTCRVPKSSEPPLTYIFCMRTEIGFTAYSTAFRKKMMAKNKDKSFVDISDEELSKEKGFKFSAPNLQIRYSLINPNGEERSGGKLDAKTYTQVSISSIPRESDKGVKSYPTRPWLEMQLHELERKGMEPRTYHVGSVEITGGPFHIAIDGQTRGLCDYIKISALTDVNEDPLFIPIMAYLPHIENSLH
eukprot:TRINITY_DN6006_c0_g2_i1.p1 TRINITY_DN6006_c0_g2~~TRINITY_DN6006_c0_g2_i1.p1  ORF type:complete len:812 (-),score=140.18 TRINITY_DN6006_c0_g2_i1:1515-3950(-)